MHVCVCVCVCVRARARAYITQSPFVWPKTRTAIKKKQYVQ
jgi:hypothetical protein